MSGAKMPYEENALLFKALADSTRLEIVDMISCNELCGCEILEKFNFSQPTLSHHMKILCACGLINGRKEGKWTYYSLNKRAVQNFKDILTKITSCEETCMAAEKSCCEGDYE